MVESHLFVTMGNILHLRCDAWLAPTDEELNIEPGWTAALPGLSDAVNFSAGPSFRQGKSFAAAALNWPETDPLPVFTSVPVKGVQAADDLCPRIAAFLREAARAVSAIPLRRTADTRRLPLLALPFFGTAAGGGDLQRGEIMRAILGAIVRELPTLGCDVVLVLREEAAFALAQDIRRTDVTNYWSQVSEEHLDHAKSLAQQAKKGRLVPFLGAGVSVTAGAPSWDGLLDSLAKAWD